MVTVRAVTFCIKFEITRARWSPCCCFFRVGAGAKGHSRVSSGWYLRVRILLRNAVSCKLVLFIWFCITYYTTYIPLSRFLELDTPSSNIFKLGNSGHMNASMGKNYLVVAQFIPLILRRLALMSVVIQFSGALIA